MWIVYDNFTGETLYFKTKYKAIEQAEQCACLHENAKIEVGNNIIYVYSSNSK